MLSTFFGSLTSFLGPRASVDREGVQGIHTHTHTDTVGVVVVAMPISATLCTVMRATCQQLGTSQTASGLPENLCSQLPCNYSIR